MGNWNDRLFLLINASDHPAASLVAAANLVAADVIFWSCRFLQPSGSGGGHSARLGLSPALLQRHSLSRPTGCLASSGMSRAPS